MRPEEGRRPALGHQCQGLMNDQRAFELSSAGMALEPHRSSDSMGELQSVRV